MNNPQIDASQYTILVVDDTKATVNLLEGILLSHGFQVQSAPNGQTALATVQTTPPDLILLDIMLPHMNGYEVCRRIKENKETQDIPVIFISALDEAWDKVRAFSAGGVDYIGKPFLTDEVIARINTHLTIRNLQKNLQEQVEELDAFARTVAHDLKNPLGVITGFAGVLVDNFSRMPTDQQLTSLQNIYQAGQKAANIVDELLLLASVKKDQMSIDTFNMGDAVALARQRVALMIDKYNAEIILPDTWPNVRGYAPWIEAVWVNYLSNGLKYGGRPPRLELGATSGSNGMTHFWIKDNGPGLTPEAQNKVFAEFARLDEVRADGHGLGLSIVQRIVERLGGKVGVESKLGQGSQFYFTLPVEN